MDGILKAVNTFNESNSTLYYEWTRSQVDFYLNLLSRKQIEHQGDPKSPEL
jgi:hypothetical protein